MKFHLSIKLIPFHDKPDGLSISQDMTEWMLQGTEVGGNALRTTITIEPGPKLDQYNAVEISLQSKVSQSILESFYLSRSPLLTLTIYSVNTITNLGVRRTPIFYGTRKGMRKSILSTHLLAWRWSGMVI